MLNLLREPDQICILSASGASIARAGRIYAAAAATVHPRSAGCSCLSRRRHKASIGAEAPAPSSWRPELSQRYQILDSDLKPRLQAGTVSRVLTGCQPPLLPSLTCMNQELHCHPSRCLIDACWCQTDRHQAPTVTSGPIALLHSSDAGPCRRSSAGFVTAPPAPESTTSRQDQRGTIRESVQCVRAPDVPSQQPQLPYIP